MAVIEPKGNSGIFFCEWLDEGYVDLPGLSVQQKNGNDESDPIMIPIITLEELLTFPREDDRSWLYWQ